MCVYELECNEARLGSEDLSCALDYIHVCVHMYVHRVYQYMYINLCVCV